MVFLRKWLIAFFISIMTLSSIVFSNMALAEESISTDEKQDDKSQSGKNSEEPKEPKESKKPGESEEDDEDPECE